MSGSPKRRLLTRSGLSGLAPDRPRGVASIALTLATLIALAALLVVLMFALPLAILVLAIAALLRPVARALRRLIRAWRANRLLSGDWWQDFERDLQAYTAPSAHQARHRERRL